MPDILVHVARGASELGSFTLAEVQELLDAGFLLSSDEGWCDDLSGRRPLPETITRLKASIADWRDKVVAGATLVSRIVGRRAGDFVAKVKTHAVDGTEALSQAKRLALEHYLPQVQKLLVEQLRHKPAAVLQAAMQDEAVMRNIFGALHDCLPRPLRRFVPGGAFVNFCVDHRQRLFASAIPATPATPAVSPTGAVVLEEDKS